MDVSAAQAAVFGTSRCYEIQLNWGKNVERFFGAVQLDGERGGLARDKLAEYDPVYAIFGCSRRKRVRPLRYARSTQEEYLRKMKGGKRTCGFQARRRWDLYTAELTMGSAWLENAREKKKYVQTAYGATQALRPRILVLPKRGRQSPSWEDCRMDGKETRWCGRVKTGTGRESKDITWCGGRITPRTGRSSLAENDHARLQMRQPQTNNRCS